MARSDLADPVEEIARIQGGAAPPVAATMFSDTRVVRPWPNLPIEDYVPGMKHHVIAAVLRGDGVSSVRFEGKRVEAVSRTGGITLLPKGHDGWWSCPGSPVCSNVYLSDRRLQLCADEVGTGRQPELLLRVNSADPKLFAILNLILAEVDAGNLLPRLYMERLIDLLCLQLLRSHSAFPMPDTPRRGGLSDRQVRRVTEFMQEHLDRSIGLQELADLTHLSRFHFCRAFRKSTGCTPHRWLMHLRMKRARDLLADPRMPVTDIALAVGYQTPSSFTLAFRSVLGVTPTDFRRHLSE